MQFYILLFEATSPPVDGALGQRLVQRAAIDKDRTGSTKV